MSDENRQNTSEEKPAGDAEMPESEGVRLPELILNKVKDELTFIDPVSGKPITFKTRIIEEESKKEEEHEPLTPDEFRKTLRRIDDLGLTWTADIFPCVKAKTPETEDALASEEFAEIQKKYPQLPRELHVATSYFLTGNKAYTHWVGTEDDLKKKAAIARELLISSDYRSEFFFKYAIKVPYLRDIDWEVVFKLFEKSVKGSPAISYGLLTLALRDPFITGRPANVQHITVAVDENLVNKLLTILNEVKAKLEKARQITEQLNDLPLLEDEDNGDANPKQLE